jgi:hypothetical protein
LCDFPEELPATVPEDGHDATQAVTLTDGDRAAQQDEHARPGLAGREEAFAPLVMSRSAEAPDARNFGIGERWEHLLTPGTHGRRDFVAHQKFGVMVSHGSSL